MDTDPCYPNPCLYGGTCLEDERTSLGYQCKCGSGFIGESYFHLTYVTRQNIISVEVSIL